MLQCLQSCQLVLPFLAIVSSKIPLSFATLQFVASKYLFLLTKLLCRTFATLYRSSIFYNLHKFLAAHFPKRFLLFQSISSLRCLCHFLKHLLSDGKMLTTQILVELVPKNLKFLFLTSMRAICLLTVLLGSSEILITRSSTP